MIGGFVLKLLLMLTISIHHLLCPFLLSINDCVLIGYRKYITHALHNQDGPHLSIFHKVIRSPFIVPNRLSTFITEFN